MKGVASLGGYAFLRKGMLILLSFVSITPLFSMDGGSVDSTDGSGRLREIVDNVRENYLGYAAIGSGGLAAYLANKIILHRKKGALTEEEKREAIQNVWESARGVFSSSDRKKAWQELKQAWSAGHIGLAFHDSLNRNIPKATILSLLIYGIYDFRRQAIRESEVSRGLQRELETARAARDTAQNQAQTFYRHTIELSDNVRQLRTAAEGNEGGTGEQTREAYRRFVFNQRAELIGRLERERDELQQRLEALENQSEEGGDVDLGAEHVSLLEENGGLIQENLELRRKLREGGNDETEQPGVVHQYLEKIERLEGVAERYVNRIRDLEAALEDADSETVLLVRERDKYKGALSIYEDE